MVAKAPTTTNKPRTTRQAQQQTSDWSRIGKKQHARAEKKKWKKQNKTTQNEQNKTKQNKTKQNKTKQNKTKQNKTQLNKIIAQLQHADRLPPYSTAHK